MEDSRVAVRWSGFLMVPIVGSSRDAVRWSALPVYVYMCLGSGRDAVRWSAFSLLYVYVCMESGVAVQWSLLHGTSLMCERRATACGVYKCFLCCPSFVLLVLLVVLFEAVVVAPIF